MGLFSDMLKTPAHGFVDGGFVPVRVKRTQGCGFPFAGGGVEVVGDLPALLDGHAADDVDLRYGGLHGLPCEFVDFEGQLGEVDAELVEMGWVEILGGGEHETLAAVVGSESLEPLEVVAVNDEVVVEGDLGR